MNKFIIFSIIGLASSLDIFEFINKDICSSDSCVTSGITMANICGEKGSTDYECLCNNMPNSFYNEMFNCTQSCEMEDHLGGVSSGAEVQEFYCGLQRANAESNVDAAGSSSSSSRASSSSSGGNANSNYYVSFIGLVLALLI